MTTSGTEVHDLKIMLRTRLLFHELYLLNCLNFVPYHETPHFNNELISSLILAPEYKREGLTEWKFKDSKCMEPWSTKGIHLHTGTKWCKKQNQVHAPLGDPSEGPSQEYKSWSTLSYFLHKVISWYHNTKYLLFR